jgi:hypothetical protein
MDFFLKKDSKDVLQRALNSNSLSIENVFQIYVWNLFSQKYSSSYLLIIQALNIFLGFLKFSFFSFNQKRIFFSQQMK